MVFTLKAMCQHSVDIFCGVCKNKMKGSWVSLASGKVQISVFPHTCPPVCPNPIKDTDEVSTSTF